MFNNKRALILLLGYLAVTVVLACGPDFPWQLLDDRAKTLRTTPVNGFVYELRRIVPNPSDSLKALEPGDDDKIEAQRSQVEKQGLSDAQAGKLDAMRAAQDGEKAYAAGEGLPTAVRLYTAAAVAFEKGDSKGAIARFQAVLSLPKDEGAARAIWAAYMLGRTYARAEDGGNADKYFAMTRDLALHGEPDPLGLAVASYNEQARVHMSRADAYLKDKHLPSDAAGAYGKEMALAADLYAEALSRGSAWSVNSLQFIGDDVFTEPSRVTAVATDPFVQRLLVIYALNKVDDGATTNSYYEGDGFHPQEAGGDRSSEVNPAVTALVAAIKAHPVKQTLGQDNLAALLYRTGHYDLAGDLVANSNTPIAAWVKAKLAIQKGDLDGAARYYAEAVQAFKTNDTGLDSYNATRLIGEQGVLSLARGEYMDAMDKLWGHQDASIEYIHVDMYWGDIAYIAERVLTTDELKQFVDAHAPTSAFVLVKKDPKTDCCDWENKYVENATAAAKLQDLLARRLVREGRYAEAMAYFHDPKDSHFSDPDVRDHVAAYSKALVVANGSGPASARAQAWFTAAVLVKRWGMEMIGYESAPDYFSTDGNFEAGYGQSKTGSDFVSKDEQRRFDSTEAKPLLRFHYRYMAVDDIQQAAALVPKHSQAYAALLCTASDWMIHTHDEEKRVKDLYTQYVRNGALVPWAKSFGSDCQAPDFSESAADVAGKEQAITSQHAAERKAFAARVAASEATLKAAQAEVQRSPYRRTRRFIGRHLRLFVSVFGLLLLAGAALGLWLILRRRAVSKAE